MKILLVGPGIMPIPSDGWGAVETVIWQQKIHLERLGHKVDILNERGTKAALKAQPWRYDIVHLHYDELTAFWNKLAKRLRLKLVITTHYGYAAQPDRWDDYYKAIFAELLKSPALLVLSEEIAKVFKKKGYKGWLQVLPNGVEVKEISFKPTGNKKAICLGKVEPRKQQALLAKKINASSDLACDFVGPLVDENFKANNKQTHYLGTWKRGEVHRNLTNYSCLILASDGEAHPLVVLEAVAAGLSVVVTEEAAANLDRSLPWIYVGKTIDADLLKMVRSAVENNDQYRKKIRAFAEKHFDWNVVAERYTEVMTDRKKRRRRVTQKTA